MTRSGVIELMVCKANKNVFESEDVVHRVSKCVGVIGPMQIVARSGRASVNCACSWAKLAAMARELPPTLGPASAYSWMIAANRACEQEIGHQKNHTHSTEKDPG